MGEEIYNQISSKLVKWENIFSTPPLITWVKIEGNGCILFFACFDFVSSSKSISWLSSLPSHSLLLSMEDEFGLRDCDVIDGNPSAACNGWSEVRYILLRDVGILLFGTCILARVKTLLLNELPLLYYSKGWKIKLKRRKAKLMK